MKDSEKSRKNWELGQEIVGKYLKGEVAGSDKVQTALQACKVHVAMMATEANTQSNVLTAVRMVLDDKERERYMRASMPQLIEKK